MNIGEIARRAGVSRATVSYALSGKRPVAAGTRKRIQDVIDALGYRPNAAARALKEGRTRTIGLVVPAAGHRLSRLQLDFVASVVESAARADLDVLLSPSGGDHDRSFERLVQESRVDGVILTEIRLEDPRVDRLQDAGLPFVGIGHTAGDQRMSWIDVDYAGLIQHCVRHLADLGHRRVALITRSQELIAAGYGPARRAREGFETALAERGLDGVEVPCGEGARSGQECVEALLRSHPDLTAATTINEAALPGIQRALADSGLDVPYDFSLTAVAATAWAEDFRPPLTAADVPAREMGEKAVSLLVERIAAPDAPPRHILLAPPIALRSSTAAAPTAGRPGQTAPGTGQQDLPRGHPDDRRAPSRIGVRRRAERGTPPPEHPRRPPGPSLCDQTGRPRAAHPRQEFAVSLTDKAIEQIRELILSGALAPGSKLPPEPELAAQLGLSRNLAREAVKALAVARVLEVKRGDGTYVTSLQPSLLLEGLGGAVELLQSDSATLLDLMEVRRLLEPLATALAATRITDDGLIEVERHLDAMREARDDVERLNAHDAAFHHAVIAVTGNETLLTLLEGISGRTLRARIRRGLADDRAAGRTLAEHEAIFAALSARDAPLSQAASLLHVSNTEQWLRRHLQATEPAGDRDQAAAPTGRP